MSGWSLLDGLIDRQVSNPFKNRLQYNKRNSLKNVGRFRNFGANMNFNLVSFVGCWWLVGYFFCTLWFPS